MLIDAEDDLVVVGEAGNGEQCIEMVTSTRPDVVLMDVRMPVVNGVEATRRLVSEEFIDGPNFAVAVLVLTTFNEDEAVYDALRAGASGYLLKNAAPSALADAIRTVARGDAWLDPAVARRLLDDFAARPDPLLPTPAEMERLTVRETEILVLAAHGLTNADIANHLVISGATVKTHIGHVLTKLNLHDRTHAVVAAYKSGLVRPGDQPPQRRTPRS
ncbi:MAG: response regulator transcription factor [Actinomycetota bacterium]|nr:response regulator transcription factor [Actinomycetota bacterium]